MTSLGPTSDPSGSGEKSALALRLANGCWLGAALFAFALCTLQAWREILDQHPVLRSKTFLALLILTGTGLAVRFLARPALRLNLLALAVAVALMELALQIAAWSGVLPWVNTKERIPWGRVYWQAEGLGNSIRNRQGWYFPDFDPTATNRIALIGDSFVEGVEVHRSRNMGAVLGERLSTRAPGNTVMSLGNHGTGPAHYLEILRYAQRHFTIHEVIMVVYIGNDIADSSLTLRSHDPTKFIYYTRTTNGNLILPPAGERACTIYQRELEAQNRPVWLLLPRLLTSHCMLVQVPLSVRNTALMQRRLAQKTAIPSDPQTALARLGLVAAPFAIAPSPEVVEAMDIMEKLLGQSATFCQEHSIRMRLAIIPFFPQDFYAQTNSPAWTAQLGGYDFLRPERELTAWAEKKNIPVLPLGDWMKRRQLTPEKIRPLYLSNGSGHFSESGHRFMAEALDAAFYAPPASGP